MINYSNIFMILFCYSGVICLFYGIYGIYKNRKSNLNIVFLAATVSLFIWSIGFSALFNSENIEYAFLWRRIASVGCISFYALLLHFLLLLTGKEKFLKNKILLFLIYLPTAICIYIFSVSRKLSFLQYDFIKTDYGWNTLPIHNFWENFFFVYFILYTLIGLGITLFWGLKNKYPNQRKTAYLIFFSFLVVFLIGSFTDVIANIFFPVRIPQIFPILSIIPISIIYYAMIKYGFLLPQKKKIDITIFSYITRKNVYGYLTIVYFIGSIISFCMQLLYYKNFLNALSTSLVILFLGLCIQFILRFKRLQKFQDMFLAAVMFISIPTITFIFLDYERITVWSSGIILILISLIFVKKSALILTTISLIVTQFVVWTIMPNSQEYINNYTHIIRIVLLSMISWISFYVNKVYVRRLEENAIQIKLQKFISDISTDFITVNNKNSREKFQKLIVNISKMLKAYKISIYSYEKDSNYFKNLVEWCAENASEVSVSNNSNIIPIHFCNWSIGKLNNNEIIQFSHINQIPQEAKYLKSEMERRKTNAIIVLPIFSNSNLFGFLSIEYNKQQKAFSEEIISALKIISNIMSDALIKIDSEKEINYMVYHDYLTKLPNRRYLYDYLKQSFTNYEKSENPIGVFFIDLDGFKGVNDTLGHEGGDVLLKTFAERLQEVISEEDMISRFGGDEFILVTNQIKNNKDISYIAEKIMNLFKTPFLVMGQEFYLTVSIGISVYPFDGVEVDELIKHADIAMYKAKGKGKNRFYICSEEMKEEIRYEIKITNDLYKALERNEFYLMYQPQVDLKTGKINSVEALIRWNHPELGLISPAIFIPIAEKSGIINDIGEWVIEQACLQNYEWQTKGYKPIRVAINISGNQLRDISLVVAFKKILRETKLDSKYIEVEVTESVAMNEFRDSLFLLNLIKELGIMISIDDFGTDYSSLGRLKRLPIDKLKIDKQFIDDIENGEKDKAIIRTIIQLAKNLQIKVIAEGVENKMQLDFLELELCDEVQGYYFYKPMISSEIEKIL